MAGAFRLILALVAATLCTSGCRERAATGDGVRAVSQPPNGSGDLPSVAPAGIEYVVAPDDGVVLSRQDAPGVVRPCSREFPAGLEGYWQPSPAEVRALESALPRRLAQDIPRPGVMRSVRRLRVYRQYVGMYRAGTRVIYINGMPPDAVEPQKDEWRRGGLQVCGGGTLFFGLVYIPSTQTFDSFEGNGPI